MTSCPTLGEHLAAWAQEAPRAAAIADTVNALAQVCASISQLVGSGALAGGLGTTGGKHGAGEYQKELDERAHQMLVEGLRDAPVAAVASEEMAEPVELDPGGALLVAIDPLDGSSNIDTNVSVATIFSVLRAPTEGSRCDADAFLQTGARQVAAGYAIYGPQTAFVLTLGAGTHIFTLDRSSGSFHLTARHVHVPATTQEFAINVSNHRYWDEPIRIYVDDCLKGTEGPRGTDFNMRWIASMVAEVHRILMRGGVFMYPKDTKDRTRPGRLRLLYEANPISLLVEQAGGRASTGSQRLMEVKPETLHQRVPLILGSRNEVERIERYHAEWASGADRPFSSPLFNERSLFRPEARL